MNHKPETVTINRKPTHKLNLNTCITGQNNVLARSLDNKNDFSIVSDFYKSPSTENLHNSDAHKPFSVLADYHKLEVVEEDNKTLHTP
eukprot:Pgem_evm1s10864